MTYGEPNIRKCVPLALGLISASKPQLPIIDALSKYSHDQDLDVALNAIFAMGLVGAGTNNARLAQMLRMLAVYYATQADCLFVIRIAQVSLLRPLGRRLSPRPIGRSSPTLSPLLHIFRVVRLALLPPSPLHPPSNIVFRLGGGIADSHT
jgi:hypothetical protein